MAPASLFHAKDAKEASVPVLEIRQKDWPMIAAQFEPELVRALNDEARRLNRSRSECLRLAAREWVKRRATRRQQASS